MMMRKTATRRQRKNTMVWTSMPVEKRSEYDQHSPPKKNKEIKNHTIPPFHITKMGKMSI